MIECIDVREIPLYKVLLRCVKDWVVDDKFFLFLSFFSLITIFYSIKAYSWLNPKGLSPGEGSPKVLADEAFTELLLLMVFSIVRNGSFFQHKSIINLKSGSNITMRHLRSLWL